MIILSCQLTGVYVCVLHELQMSAVPLCFGNKTFVLFKSDGGLYDINTNNKKKRRFLLSIMIPV